MIRKSHLVINILNLAVWVAPANAVDYLQCEAMHRRYIWLKSQTEQAQLNARERLKEKLSASFCGVEPKPEMITQTLRIGGLSQWQEQVETEESKLKQRAWRNCERNIESNLRRELYEAYLDGAPDLQKRLRLVSDDILKNCR